MKTINYAIDFIIKNPAKIYKFVLFTWCKMFGINPEIKLGNIKMVLDLDAHVDRNLFFNGVVDPDLKTFIEKYLKEDGVFFDIGANSGYFSIIAASNAPKGTVYSFEPVPRTFNNLKKTVHANGNKNISLFKFCIGGKNGSTTFNISHSSDVSGMKQTEYQTNISKIKTKVVNLDTFIVEHKIKVIDMVKIDTEGAEFEIISNSPNLINKIRPILVVEFSNKTSKPYNFTPAKLHEYLLKKNYLIYRFKRERLTKQKIKEVYEENLFCIPREKSKQLMK